MKPKIHYDHFRIRKRKNKYRYIYSPSKELKEYQLHFLTEFYKVKPHFTSHGFVPGKSIVTNAAPHVGKKFVLSMDISNFFPNTKTGKVLNLMQRFFPQHLVNHPYFIYKEHLPQGAPTSPYLANFALYDFDVEIYAYCIENNINYTRYADDLTFSYNQTDLKNLLTLVNKLLAKYKYFLSKRKTKLMPSHTRQKVTGVIVNQKLSIPREVRNHLRALNHVSKTQTLENYSADWLAGMNGYKGIIK